MQATNTYAIHDALVTAIRSITPRYPYLSSCTWHHSPAARDTEIEGAALRNFILEMSPAQPNDLFFGQGQSYETTLRVVTGYTAVEPSHLDHMVSADNIDLWLMFESLYDPTVPGLFSIEPQGVDVRGASIDEAGNVVIDHVFRVVYNQEL